MTRRKNKERLIPKQNKLLIAGICCCQLTVVLSLVAIIYLSVAIYMPSFRAFKSGFETTPVMCQTIKTVMINNCSWASCGEWCLTKTTGFCPQIHVIVRRNGTDLTMKNCTSVARSSCPPVKKESFYRYNCNNDKECGSLTGLVNCSFGHCINISEKYLCDYKGEGPFIDSEKDNMKLNGYFACNDSRCAKIKKPISCDRYCENITTSGMKIYMSHNNDVYSTNCQKIVTATKPETVIWTNDRSKKAVLLSCSEVKEIDKFTLSAFDCINGTLIPEWNIPRPSINHSLFWLLYQKNNEPVDLEEKFVPSQKSLTIYNTSRLYINLDGCVNTLKGECKEFLATHGKYGKNRTAQSRFPCFYNKENSSKTIARYDLEKTWRELLVSLIVPFVFFILSFVTLIIITRSVKVGDDSVLRCQLFKIPSKESDKTKPNDQSKIDEIENDALDEGMDESPKITMVEKLLDSNGGTIAL